MDIKNTIRLFIAAISVGLLLSACGGGSDTPVDDPEVGAIESNPDFVAKAKAVNLQQIKLYPGHINPDSRKPAEVDTSNLNSGDLITIEVTFDNSAGNTDYALSARLIPQALFPLIRPGTILSDVIDTDKADAQNIELIELSGVFLQNLQAGTVRGYIHTKLPVLSEQSAFKLVVTPAIEFLSSNKPINKTDADIIPVLIDSRDLIINKLDSVSVKLTAIPDLAKENDFTALETDAAIGANGFTQDPLFQTSIDLDLTTFNDTETVILQLDFLVPGGGVVPLGLLSADADENPVVSLDASFRVNRSEENTTRIPVVAFASEQAQKLLLKFATPIREIADSPVIDGQFQLHISYLENGTTVSAGPAVDLLLPLVRQPNRLQQQTAKQALGFTVLRAGSTNVACLSVSADIDTGKIINDSSTSIGTSTCIDTPTDAMLWRYEVATQQFISKITDLDNDNYCITVNAEQVITLPGGGSGSGSVKAAKLEKCIVPGIFQQPTLNSTQKLAFEGKKIKSNLGYLQVGTASNGFTQLMVVDEANAAADFFRDNNGIALDDDGRLFYLGKFNENGWGSEDKAKISLSYGAESFMDYMPVIGNTNRGHVQLSFTLFDIAQANIIDVNFAVQRYLNKKISFSGKNSPNVVVGNGASFNFDLFGNRIISQGEIVNSTITETFDPLNDVGNIVLPDINVEPSDPVFKQQVDHEFFNQIFMVWIIPLRISGGLEGTLDINYALTTPDLSAAAGVTQTMALKGFLRAVVAEIGGITGSIEAINQKLTFNANAGFTMNNTEPKISLDIGTSLLNDINLLKGEVDAFVNYISLFSFKKKQKTVNLYSSPYLFSDKSTLFDKNLLGTVVEY